jgi:hypothetical protein
MNSFAELGKFALASFAAGILGLAQPASGAPRPAPEWVKQIAPGTWAEVT